MVLDAMILISHKNEPKKAYLPGSKDTVISKAVPSGRDSTIALRWRWSLRFPQMWETREHNLWELGTAFALSPYIILLRETEAMEPVPWPIPLSFFEYWSILINVIPLFYFYQHLEKNVKNKLGLLRTTKKKSKMYVFKVLFERKMKKKSIILTNYEDFKEENRSVSLPQSPSLLGLLAKIKV